jgi:hypothetical protein
MLVVGGAFAALPKSRTQDGAGFRRASGVPSVFVIHLRCVGPGGELQGSPSGHDRARDDHRRAVASRVRDTALHAT